MILFLLGMFIALLTNSATISQVSSIDSLGNRATTITAIEWLCPNDYDETCFMTISDQGIETGP
jgi:hypothetical protein